MLRFVLLREHRKRGFRCGLVLRGVQILLDGIISQVRLVFQAGLAVSVLFTSLLDVSGFGLDRIMSDDTSSSLDDRKIMPVTNYGADFPDELTYATKR